MNIFRLCSTLFTVQPLPVSELYHLHFPSRILRVNKMKKLIIPKHFLYIYALSFLMFVTVWLQTSPKNYLGILIVFFFSTILVLSICDTYTVLYSRCAQLRWNFLVLYLEWRFLAYTWNEPSWFRTWNRDSLACFMSCSLCLACYVAIEATWYKFIDDNRILSFFKTKKWTLNLKYFFQGFIPSQSLSSVQFSRSVVSYSLWPHESQHARPPYPSPTPGVYSNSCLLSQWCHPAISSSVIPFSSCPQSLPA